MLLNITNKQQKMMKKLLALGPEWSYSSEVAKNILTDNISKQYYIEYVQKILWVFEWISKSNIWILPIKNNYWWLVNDHIENLYSRRNILQIIGSTKLKIKHCLATKHSSSEIKTVFSHPQALKQCKNNISNFQKVETSSTTERVSSLLPWEAIICSKNAAELNWLHILDDNIAPWDNETEFLIIWDKDHDYWNIELNWVKKEWVIEILSPEEFIIKNIWWRINNIINFITTVANWKWWFDYVCSFK